MFGFAFVFGPHLPRLRLEYEHETEHDSEHESEHEPEDEYDSYVGPW